MTPNQRSIGLGLLMVLAGLAAVVIALAMVLPVAVNLPDSWFGGVLAFLAMALGIAFTYFGGQRLWGKPR